MARQEDSFWYDLGRGVGTVISVLPGSPKPPSDGHSRRPDPRRRSRSLARKSSESRERAAEPGLEILAGGITALVISALRGWTGGGRSSPSRLLRGAIAGAGAAGAIFAFRLLSGGDGSGKRGGEGDLVGDVADELLAGAGRGLIYATLLEPLLPGPAFLRGAAAGALDYAATPLGGIFSSLQSLSPIRRVPVISILLETGDAEDDSFLSFIAHGVLLGLLYGEPEADEES